MKRHVPGLHSRPQDRENLLQGLVLVRVDSASHRWHPQKPFLSLRFVVLEPEAFVERSLSGRLYCTERALWKLNWFFCVISAMTPICSTKTRLMRRLC